MPHFLTRAEVYRVIQRELPEDVYPDGQPSAYFSTADSDATAGVIADAYANLNTIWLNNFPQTAVERLNDWEEKVFGYQPAGLLTVAQRQARLLGKLRVKRSLRAADQLAIVAGVIGADVFTELLPWGCPDGDANAWGLGVSQLGVNTYLGDFGLFFATGPNLCHQTSADWGMSASDWTHYMEMGNSFDLRIYTNVRNRRSITTTVGEYVTFGQPSDINAAPNTQHITISLWCKRTRNSFETLISKADRSNAFNLNYFLFFTDPGTIGFIAGGGGVSTNVAVTDTKWHHIAVTATSGAILVYLDGLPASLVAAGGAGATTQAVDWLIGAARLGPGNSGSANEFVGEIKDVSIWGVAFTAAEVAQLVADHGVPSDLLNHTQRANLLHWYRCGDGAGDDDNAAVVKDLAGSADGTIVGGARFLFDGPPYPNLDEVDRQLLVAERPTKQRFLLASFAPTDYVNIFLPAMVEP